MASLKDIARECIDEAREGIAWTVLWRAVTELVQSQMWTATDIREQVNDFFESDQIDGVYFDICNEDVIIQYETPGIYTYRKFMSALRCKLKQSQRGIAK